jgi:hypothetical protein
MSRRPASLEIDTWHVHLSPRFARPVSYSAVAATVGLIGAAAVHVALISALMLGGFGYAARPATKSKEVSLQFLSPMNEPTLAVSPMYAQFAVDGLALVSIDRRKIATPPSIVRNNDEINAAREERPEGYLRKQQFGIYTGQIIARVERAWSRPRTPVLSKGEVSSDFMCQVKILQTSNGSVSEVDLLNCNVSPAWQQSLVRAIFSASPLPAPPNPTVFEDALTLTFSAHEFHAGDAEDGYAIADPAKQIDEQGI